MRLATGQYVLILALLSSCAVNARFAKRDTDSSVSDPPGSGGPNTSSLQKLLQSALDFVLQIPLIGNLLGSILDGIAELILGLELLTNGAIARLLGGALPCVVSLDNHFECTGITKNGGIVQLLENVVDKLPELLLPETLKKLVKMLLRGVLGPTLDILFGGLPDIPADT